MNKIKLLTLLWIVTTVISCDEDEILKEVPLDFLTIENALVTPSDVDNSIISLYDLARRYFGDQTGDGFNFDMFYGTDAGYHARFPRTHVLSVYTVFTADDAFTLKRWEKAYRMIFDANVILNNIDNITFSDEAQKAKFIAEARFFRAWSYRNLVHLYGDVPLLLDDDVSPRTDYTRAPKEAVWDQIIADFEYATENLPDVTQITQDGRLSKAAAYHMLAEMYIVTGEYQKSVDAASWVIDGGNYQLMTQRFGSRVDEPGDVYWDLFRLNNQNRTSGNTESIWVHQVDYQTPGGYGLPTGADANFYERIIGPEYNRFIAAGEKPGVRTFIYESDYNGGRGQGWFRPGPLATHIAWQGNQANDIRTSDANILRKWRVDNPQSNFYNQIIDVGDPTSYYSFVDPATIENDTNRMLYPYFLKMTMVNNHFPTDMLNGVGPQLIGDARRLYTDQYAIRLAETYLLRAEAYLGLGNAQLAADDINVVRGRANATPVTPGEVDIDYILDERIRELYLEEPRRVTLARLGMVYERTVKYNPYAAPYIKEHNNLYPIPSREIRINDGAVIEQNPGYN